MIITYKQPQCSIKIILKSTNRLFSLFHFKDVFHEQLQSHIVHKFSCGNSNVTYYGKTERHFNVRSGEHLRISHLTGERVGYNPSAASDHLLMHNYDSDFKDFTIPCRDNSGYIDFN